MELDNRAKKALAAQYKEREVIGGVYTILNKANNKMLFQSAYDLRGAKNRFEFAQKTGSCIHPKLQSDWLAYGKDSFALNVLETLKKGDTQTASEFQTDIDVLADIWLEKLSNENLY